MGFVPVTDYNLHYNASEFVPNRPTLLLIHGMMTDSTIWSRLLPRFGQSVNWIVYDRGGHGQSGNPTDGPSLQDFQSEVLSLMDALGVKQVHLAGCGLGSALAFEMARQYPDRVLSVTLIASVFFLPEQDFGQSFQLFKQLAQLDPELLLEKVEADLFEESPGDYRDDFRRAFRRLTPVRIQTELDWLLRTYSPARFNFADALSELKQPALVLHGIHDRLVPQRMSALFAACIPESRWFPISHAAHYPSLDAPNQTAELMIKFLAGIFQPIASDRPYQRAILTFRQQIHYELDQKAHQKRVLTMHILQPFAVRWNGHEIIGKWNQRGAKELLLYLMLHHGFASRETLIRTFLPDMTPAQAHNHLRVRISHLNKIFDSSADPSASGILLVDDARLVLRAKPDNDLLDFRQRLTRLLSEKHSVQQQATDFSKLLTLYDPACFSSFHGEWIDTMIHQIERDMGRVLQHLIPTLQKKGRRDLLLSILQRARLIEPYDGYCDEWLAQMQSGIL